MQGVILLGLRRFIQEHFGDSVWRTVQEDADVAYRLYLPLQTYRADDLKRLVRATSDATGIAADKLLESFGEFIAPDLLRTYATLLDPRWKNVDIVANAETIIRRALGLNHAGEATEMRVRWRSTGDVLITYISKQRLCALMRGFIRGVASHLREAVVVIESACMLLGARQCEIVIKQPGSLSPRRPTVPPSSFPRRRSSGRGLSQPPPPLPLPCREPATPRSKHAVLLPPAPDQDTERACLPHYLSVPWPKDSLSIEKLLASRRPRA